MEPKPGAAAYRLATLLGFMGGYSRKAEACAAIFFQNSGKLDFASADRQSNVMTKVLILAMSARTGSFNKKLAQNAHRILSAELKAQSIQIYSLRDFSIPLYDGDIESSTGIPEGVQALGKAITEAQCVIIVTPEYNAGIPAPSKNAIDWVSRMHPVPWAKKQILLIGTSPGALGATRSLWHSRQPLDSLGCFVYPEMMGVPLAGQAFDEADRLKDVKTEERLKKLLLSFIQYATAQSTSAT